MRLTIVESSATTRLSLLFRARAKRRRFMYSQLKQYVFLMLQLQRPTPTNRPGGGCFELEHLLSDRSGDFALPRPVCPRRLQSVPYASPRVVVVEPPWYQVSRTPVRVKKTPV